MKKRKFKKALAGILSAALVLSAFSTMSFGASAAESDIVGTESVSYEPEAESTTVPETEPETQPVTSPDVVEVGQVKNLHKINNYTDNITIVWDKLEGASGYIVTYCNVEKTTEFTKIGEFSADTTSIKFTKLDPTTRYNFKVYAFVDKDGTRYIGDPVLIRTVTKTAVVGNPRLTYSSSNIKFAWDKVARASGYRIYRAENNPNGKYTLIKTLGGGSTSFADYNVKSGNGYFYKIIAYRTYYYGLNCEYTSVDAKINAVSNLTTVTVTHASRLGRINLTWTRAGLADGYDIFLSDKKDGSYSYLGTTSNRFFNTKKLTNNKTYYFKVLPFKYVGSSKTKVRSVHTVNSRTVTNQAFGQNVGSTYIEISIDQQHMWMYKNGNLLVETDVVTGNADGAHNTPRGVYQVWQKASPATLVGADYVSKVTYWLAFTYSGCGIHDASWRSSFGGNIYKGNGSHGCVNTPYNAVKKIYQNAGIGTNVVLY